MVVVLLCACVSVCLGLAEHTLGGKIKKAKQINLYSYGTFHCGGNALHKQTRNTIRCSLKNERSKTNQMHQGKQMFSVCFLTMIVLKCIQSNLAKYHKSSVPENQNLLFQLLILPSEHP